MSKKNYEAKSVKKEDHFAEHSLSWDQKYIIPNILNYSIGNLEKSLKIPTHPLNPCTDHPIPYIYIIKIWTLKQASIDENGV